MSALRKVTASKSKLALACSYWRRPDVPLPDETSEAAEFGTEVHAAIEDALEHGRAADACRPEVADHVRHALYFVAKYAARPKATEQAFAMLKPGVVVNVGTGRESYSGVVADVAGTVDLLVHLSDGRWLVVDWKTGRADRAAEQLRTLASLVLLANDGETCAMVAVSTSDGYVHDYGMIDSMDAFSWLGLIAEDRGEEPHQGDHCHDGYCPLRGTCPAFTAPVAAALPQVTELVRERRNPLVVGVSDLETAQTALEVIPLVEERIKALKDQVKAFAASVGGQVYLPDGRAYRAMEQSRETVDGKGALELARKLGATDEDVEPLVRRTTYEVWKVVGKKDGGK